MSSPSRAQVGGVPTEILWRELVDGLPKGLPARDDCGLDNTHTWGPTYWGGALSCLMADIEIHQRTTIALGSGMHCGELSARVATWGTTGRSHALWKPEVMLSVCPS